MTAKELFGVGVRLIGLAATLIALPAVFELSYSGMLPGVAGLILLTRADLIAHLCYPPDRRDKDWREKVPKDFRDG